MKFLERNVNNSVGMLIWNLFDLLKEFGVMGKFFV